MFKPIHLECYQELKSFAEDYLKSNWNFVNEKIIRMPFNEYADFLNRELTEKYGWPGISMWSIFARGKGNQQQIHVDCAFNGSRVNNAIIIPIVGTKGSKFQWFDYDAKLEKILLPDGKSHYYYAVYDTEPAPIAEHEILEPIIANVRNPHRAIASDDQPRAVISIKLEYNPLLL